MRSFFEPATKAKVYTSPRKSNLSFSCSTNTPTPNLHDSSKFWSMLGAGSNTDTEPFATLSVSAINSRKRRVRNVQVSNPFDQQVYYEERVISIRNKYKYLSFREDERPPYGTTALGASQKVALLLVAILLGRTLPFWTTMLTVRQNGKRG